MSVYDLLGNLEDNLKPKRKEHSEVPEEATYKTHTVESVDAEAAARFDATARLDTLLVTLTKHPEGTFGAKGIPSAGGGSGGPEDDLRGMIKLPELPYVPVPVPVSLPPKVVKHIVLTSTVGKVSLKGVVDTLEADLKAFEENEGLLAGDVAIKALMALRRLKDQNRKKRIKFWVRLFMFLLIFGGGTGGFGYWASTQIVKTRNIMTRTCSVPLGGNTFTGIRELSYPVRTLFGFQLIDKSQVEETTKLDIRGSKVNIIGLKDGAFAWRRNITDGERYDQLLKEADTYILFTDKDTTVVPYELFCK